MLLPAISKLLVHQNTQARRRKGKMHQNNGLQMFQKQRQIKTNKRGKHKGREINQNRILQSGQKEEASALQKGPRVGVVSRFADFYSAVYIIQMFNSECFCTHVRRIVMCSNASVLKLLDSEVPRNPLKASQSLKVCSVQVYIGKVQSFVLL